jgi:hypothetical protein
MIINIGDYMKVITIGDIDYSRTKIQNNIKKTYKLSLEGEHNNWYQEAQDFGADVSKLFDIPLSKVLGIVSVLSPLKEWSKNKEIAIEFIASGDCGHMKNNKRKAKDILALKSRAHPFIRLLNYMGELVFMLKKLMN